jgi:NTP pyrophosphatase (non-canonical NTP hydrolase)
MDEENNPEETLTLSAYLGAALTSDRNKTRSLTIPLLGLFGETGSLLSVAKKKQRDGIAYRGYGPAVIEELGDVLWYLAVTADRAELTLDDIARAIDNTLPQSGEIPFQSLQQLPTVIQLQPTEAFEATLLDLAGEVGTLLSDHQAHRLHNNRAALLGRLVAIMRMLIRAADESGVTLAQAARNNLDKIFNRWPPEGQKRYPDPLDHKSPSYEQLPRSLTIDIFERNLDGKLYVFQTCNGINIGDRLTDNALTPDDYRFHDVFHYAYAAVLTWSPVLRALLRLKRKSDPLIDEAEDGARAILIEEGISTWIFGQSRQLSDFENIQPGELSFDMLRQIRQFVEGYEPACSPLWLWEEAILQGFEAFRFLKKHRRGRLTIDIGNRRLTVEELPLDA